MNNSASNELYPSQVENKILPESKRTIALSLLPTVFCVAAGCALIYFPALAAPGKKLIGFVLLGVFFTFFYYKKLAGAAIAKPFLFALSAAVMVVLAVTIFSYISHRFDAFYNLAYAAAFLWPFFALQAAIKYLDIPPAAPTAADKPEPWFLPVPLPVKPQVVYIDNVSVRLKLTTCDGQTFSFSSRSPVQLHLGTAFYFMVSDYNTASRQQVPLTKEGSSSHGWVFYTKRYGVSKRWLHPEENLYNNGITAGATIYAECVA